MSDYSENYRSYATRQFIDKWAPKDKYPDKSYSVNERWWIARANKAEAQVVEYENWFSQLFGFLNKRSIVIHE